MLKTLNTQLISDKNSQISNSNSQVKLIRRTSRSNSFKIKRSESNSALDQSFPTYFIKKVPKLISKQNQQELQTADVTPVKIIQRKTQHELITQRKRQPTPVKSYKDLTGTARTQKKIDYSQINIEKQMEIHELQKKLLTESKIRLMYQQRSKQFQNQVSIQIKKLRNVEKQLQLSKDRENKLSIKISQLQTQLDHRNNDLKNTKSNLQKLKQNIAEVRAQQFQTQINKSKQQIEKLKALNEQQSKQNNILKNQNTSLKMEINHIKNISDQNRLKAQEESRSTLLKKQIEHLKFQLNASSTEKQKFLQQKVIDLQKQIQKLKKINQSKIIELDFLARKKHQEFQALKKRKGQELKSLRIKFAALMDEYKSLKDQKNNLKSKDRRDSVIKLNDRKSVQKRQNRFACPTSTKDRTQEDFICFSLSPQVK